MISRRSGTCQIFLRRSGVLRHKGRGELWPIKSRMSLIVGQIESEHTELFALEFGKNC